MFKKFNLLLKSLKQKHLKIFVYYYFGAYEGTIWGMPNRIVSLTAMEQFLIIC